MVKSKEVRTRSLVMGNPAVRKGDVSSEMVAHKTEGTALCQALPMDCQHDLVPTEPLVKVPKDRVETFPHSKHGNVAKARVTAVRESWEGQDVASTRSSSLSFTTMLVA